MGCCGDFAELQLGLLIQSRKILQDAARRATRTLAALADTHLLCAVRSLHRDDRALRHQLFAARDGPYGTRCPAFAGDRAEGEARWHAEKSCGLCFRVLDPLDK